MAFFAHICPFVFKAQQSLKRFKVPQPPKARGPHDIKKAGPPELTGSLAG